jgi:hypothetical protein
LVQKISGFRQYPVQPKSAFSSPEEKIEIGIGREVFGSTANPTESSTVR